MFQGVTITHLQEHKTTVITELGNRYTVLLSAAIVEELELIREMMSSILNLQNDETGCGGWEAKFCGETCGRKKYEIRENASDESHERHTSSHASRRGVWQVLARGDLSVKFWWMTRRQ